MGDATAVAGGIYLLDDVRGDVADEVGCLPEIRVDRQQEVFAQHTFDDIFRRAHHIIVLVATFYLGKHHLVDIESLVDDTNLLARLLLVPFREVGKHVLVYVVSPVIHLENLLSVLLVVTAYNQEEKSEE